jgi:hypothetical protein
MENIKLHRGSLAFRLKTHDAHAALITIDNEELRRYPTNIHLDKEDRELLFIIINKKGYFIGTKPEHRDRGKYMPIPKILDILEENPDWIRIKKVSNKFGL